MSEPAPGLPWIRWFPRDFASSTRGWPLLARAIYRELLDAQWDLGGLLPDDPEQLREIARATTDEWLKAWRFVEIKFPQVSGGRRNPRLEEHRQIAIRERESRARGARRTNEKRWGNGSLSESPSESVSETLSESLSDNSATVERVASSSISSSISSSSDSEVLEDSDFRPQPTLARTRPAYESKEFHNQVIASYHEALADLPAVKVWSSKRAQALNARIRERCSDGKPADTIDYWRKLFKEVSCSAFLCGRTTDFRADLEWLLRPENFTKVIEGRYTAHTAANGRAAHAG